MFLPPFTLLIIVDERTKNLSYSEVASATSYVVPSLYSARRSVSKFALPVPKRYLLGIRSRTFFIWPLFLSYSRFLPLQCFSCAHYKYKTPFLCVVECGWTVNGRPWNYQLNTTASSENYSGDDWLASCLKVRENLSPTGEEDKKEPSSCGRSNVRSPLRKVEPEVMCNTATSVGTSQHLPANYVFLCGKNAGLVYAGR